MVISRPKQYSIGRLQVLLLYNQFNSYLLQSHKIKLTKKTQIPKVKTGRAERRGSKIKNGRGSSWNRRKVKCQKCEFSLAKRSSFLRKLRTHQFRGIVSERQQ